MHVDDWWNAIKGVGSLGGIFSTFHIAWRWLTRGHPVAIIKAQPLIQGSLNIEPILYMLNPSDRPILIRFSNNDETQLRTAKDDSVEGFARALIGMTLVASIDANSSKEFKLITPTAYEDVPNDQKVRMAFEWKFAQPLFWPGFRRKHISITKIDLDHLLDGYSPQ